MKRTFWKKNMISLLLVLFMAMVPLTLTACKNGRDGADGSAWLTGTQTPDAAQGKDGDLYLDTDDHVLYQKANGTWSVLQSNFGVPGTNGTNGTDGEKGEDGITPTVTVNSDGYWVINGVVTNTKAQGQDGVTPTVSINGQGYWVINGVPSTVKAQGQDGTTPTVSINGQGYWVINGVPSDVKAQGRDGTTPTVSINDQGFWVINGVPTGTRAEAINGSNGEDGSLWTVGDTYPTAPKASDLFLNNTTWELFQYDGTQWVSKGKLGGEEEEEKVVDLVIFMGQSNMAGRGVAAQAPVVQEGHGYEFRAVSDPTKLYPIQEPFGVNENRGVISETTKTGSLVSAFAESYYAYTGVPIVGVSASKGGQKIEFWATDGDALNETITRYTAAKTYLSENGYTVRHQYMVWLQGESDGATGTSPVVYKNSLITLFGEMHKQGVEKAMIIRIGERQADDTLHDGIILAQTELCREYEEFVMISGKLAGVSAADMKDSAHFKQSTYNEVGADAGKNMAYHANTGMEPYFYDPEYNNYYPFDTSADKVDKTVDQLIVDVSDSDSPYDFTTVGTVSDGKVTVSENHSDVSVVLEDTVILSDDYSWTCEFIAGNFTDSGGVTACSGTSGAGFINLPYRDGPTPISSGYAQFRFRDEAKTLQIDIEIPDDYDKDVLHHYALVYDATTRTFRAYIDYVECEVVYTTGLEGGAFTDTELKNLLGGYPSTSNAKCDFYYFAFNKKVMSTNEMKAMPTAA